MNQSAPRFVVAETLVARGTVSVGEDAAQHMRVLRLGAGNVVMLLDGEGGRANGVVRSVSKRNATVEIETVESEPAPRPLHALVPIADRDRMLWLGEKAAELAVSSWRPVLWSRSRSVAPRGDSPSFQAKVRARMASALEQSGNAWMPVIYPGAPLDRALASLPDGARYSLDKSGDAIGERLTGDAPAAVTIALGPEGGLTDEELGELDRAGFTRVSLGPTTMRFETAGVVALATARAMLSYTKGR